MWLSASVGHHIIGVFLLLFTLCLRQGIGNCDGLILGPTMSRLHLILHKVRSVSVPSQSWT